MNERTKPPRWTIILALLALAGIAGAQSIVIDTDAHESIHLPRWKDGIVPFMIVRNRLDDQCIENIREGMLRWAEATVVEFRPATHEDRGIMRFREGSPSSWSGGGTGATRHGAVMLDHNCTVGTVLHEVGHALGLPHEHQRPDRDLFVAVNPWTANGRSHYSTNDVYEWHTRFPYDYRSSMNYFVQPIPFGLPMRSVGISPGMIDRVNSLYMEADKPLTVRFTTNAYSFNEHVNLPLGINGVPKMTPVKIDNVQEGARMVVEAPARAWRLIDTEWRDLHTPDTCHYEVFDFLRWSTAGTSTAYQHSVRIGSTWNEANYKKQATPLVVKFQLRPGVPRMCPATPQGRIRNGTYPGVKPESVLPLKSLVWSDKAALPVGAAFMGIATDRLYDTNEEAKRYRDRILASRQKEETP